MSNTSLPNFNYPAGTIIEIDGRPHHPPVFHFPGRMTLIDCHTGQPFLVPDGDNGTALPTQDDYNSLLISGRVEVKFPQKVIASRALAAVAEWDWSDLEKIDPGIRKVLAQVEILDENGVKNGIKAVTNGLTEYWNEDLEKQYGKHDSPHTVKRWRSERGKPGARVPRLMARLTGKVPRQPQDSDVSFQIRMKYALLCNSSQMTVKSAYAAATDELICVNEDRSKIYPKPDKPYLIFSYTTFWRDCAALKGSDTIEARDGKDLMNSKMRGAGRSLTAGRILEKVIIDHTPLDAFVVIDLERDIVAGRPFLTLALDVHSRAILGWVISFRPPSYWTVCEILRRMGLPKRPPPYEAERYPILKYICGKPTELILDNAAEFTSHSLEDAAKCGGFSVRFCPIKAPRYRAPGERVIATIQNLMLENLPGRTKPIKEARREGYDPEDRAVATIDEIEALANMAFVEYHTTPHEGLDGRQPALVFQKSANKHGIDVMADFTRFYIEMMETKHNIRVTNSGVDMFNGLHYQHAINVPRLIDNCLRFEPRRQKYENATIHTKVKFDPENIAKIHVWDKTTRSYVELNCSDDTYADGMPLWFHEELVSIAKREATAKPKPTAQHRTKKSQKTDEPYIKSLAEAADDEVAPTGFNTEAERLNARARRIEAVRAIAPRARHQERLTLARLYETPRLRQITGNIVELSTDFAHAVTTSDFIAHDVASLTAFDLEVLSPRPTPKAARARTGKYDRVNAGKPHHQNSTTAKQDERAQVSRRRRARG